MSAVGKSGQIEAVRNVGFLTRRAAHYAEQRGRPHWTGAELLVAIFAEREGLAAQLLGAQDMTSQGASNFIIRGIVKGGGESSV
jgi:ATP-dependent Clp protease ATP-binding subunit ClpA